MTDKPQSGYKPEKHSALPYVDKLYKDLLDRSASKDRRNKKSQVEYAIEADFINKFGYEEYRALKDAYDASVSK